MSKAKMTCRICGKEYEPCRTAIKNPNVFHWQEVACSPECGAEYLQRVMESRKGTEIPKRGKHKKVSEPKTKYNQDASDNGVDTSADVADMFDKFIPVIPD